ncbi:hypothetical protein Q3A66_16355 [Hymenobacter sp. BT770]|uniref:hypothetical protein n=1 Tax=Hymenobacter sp. BT770 TaxID=2886942 RepID=UPI001D119B3D|nr:hypothetical protein [Hymenobacter sp. BT770]MCC3154588.1 hypothetical protein [Hymenobacter sp. BT770]MDO3416642.1 hypothetical protein [Hymenobacter sp. BT770]
MFSTRQIQALEAGKAANSPAIRTLAQAELPASVYASFVYNEYWLTGQATIDELLATLKAASSDLGGPLCYLPHKTLAGRTAQTRELLAQRVPFITEFGQHLTYLERGSPLEWLAYLTQEIHKAEPEDVDYFFTEIAATLQHEIVIRTATADFRITELEIYYNGRNHPDPYVHKGPEQLKHLHWYFNKASSLDLTFGDQESNSFGGILLRGLEQLPLEPTSEPASAGLYTSGPRNIVRTLVANWGSALYNSFHFGLANAPAPIPRPKQPWRTQRFGLVLRADDTSANPYFARPYRFLTNESYLKQLKNKEAICQEQQLDADTAYRILGYKPSWL